MHHITRNHESPTPFLFYGDDDKELNTTACNSHTTGACTFSQADHYCTTTTSANSITNQPQIRIFPNPTASELRVETFEFRAGEFYQIFDYTGKLYEPGIVVSNDFVIDVSQLPIGLYSLRIDYTNLKFVKR